MQGKLTKVWVVKDAIRFMANETQKMYPLETGGVLMGYWDQVGNNVVVTACVGPGINAIHEKYDFIPDQEFHKKEIARYFYASDRTETYLGDWHSHPDQNHGRISFQDRLTIKKIAQYPQSRLSEPIMLIVYGEPEDWHLSGWKFNPMRFSFFFPFISPLIVNHIE